jgi:hypothetical protein
MVIEPLPILARKPPFGILPAAKSTMMRCPYPFARPVCLGSLFGGRMRSLLAGVRLRHDLQQWPWLHQ